jgi:hypothetical protein
MIGGGGSNPASAMMRGMLPTFVSQSEDHMLRRQVISSFLLCLSIRPPAFLLFFTFLSSLVLFIFLPVSALDCLLPAIVPFCFCYLSVAAIATLTPPLLLHNRRLYLRRKRRSKGNKIIPTAHYVPLQNHYHYASPSLPPPSPRQFILPPPLFVPNHPLTPTLLPLFKSDMQLLPLVALHLEANIANPPKVHRHGYRPHHFHHPPTLLTISSSYRTHCNVAITTIAASTVTTTVTTTNYCHQP